jgi:hypothetical protein
MTDILNRHPPRAALDWAVRAVGGGRAVAVERLRGGLSRASHMIRIDTGAAAPLEVVLRR